MQTIIPMRFSSVFILGLLTTLVFSVNSGYAACAIESGPTAPFATYLRDSATQVGTLRSFASSNNKCTGTNGTFSNENRFFSLLDRIDTQVAITPNLFDDFQYSILLTAEGNSRGPVIAQGKLIRNLETNTLIPGLKSIASACALDVTMPDGRTPEEAMGALILANRALEAYYKWVALGNARIPDGLEPSMQSLYENIRDNYSPEKTASCKADAGVDSMEDLMKKIMDRIWQAGKKTEWSQNSWEEAIALFQGKWAETDKYKNLQMKLLATELSRQWLAGKARDAMLGNLTCFQQHTTPTSTPEEIGQARTGCTNTLVAWLENLTNWYKPLIFKSASTDEFMVRLRRYDTEKKRLTGDMASFWEKIEKTKNADEALNEKMVTDLVNIHARLVITNEILAKKIPEMQANCMKAQPDIVGGCRAGQ